VNVFPTQIEEQVLKIEELAPHYQIEVRRDDNLDAVKVLVELTPEVGDLGIEARDRIAQQLRHHIKSLVGVTTNIDIGDVGAIPRSQGKAQRVIDLRR
jgi:phenylacetate-CoA ligase